MHGRHGALLAARTEPHSLMILTVRFSLKMTVQFANLENLNRLAPCWTSLLEETNNHGIYVNKGNKFLVLDEYFTLSFIFTCKYTTTLSIDLQYVHILLFIK